MPDVCQVLGCRSTLKYCKGYALFSVPADPDLREKWITFLGFDNCAVVKSAKICSYHFEEKYIKHNQKRTRLTRSAVPSLHPPEDSLKSQRPFRRKVKCGPQTAAASCEDDARQDLEFVSCSCCDGESPLFSEMCEEKPSADCIKPDRSCDPLSA